MNCIVLCSTLWSRFILSIVIVIFLNKTKILTWDIQSFLHNANRRRLPPQIPLLANWCCSEMLL